MPTNSPLTKLRRSASTEEVIVSEHLADLRGRVRMLTWISGSCWTLLVLLGGLIVTGTLDWLIHFDDSGTRLVFGLGLLGGAGWMFWQQLVAPLRQPLTGSFLASRVERRFPGLKNRVVSAVEFLEHRLDPKLGSSELQRAVVGQALNDLDRIEPADVIETKAVRNVTIAGGLVCAIAATILMLHPAEAATSVQRLMFPFSRVPWPRAVELQLVKPDLSPVVQAADEALTIARGDTLELYVLNARGRLPERVWFEYRMDDQPTVVREPLRQTTLRDEKGKSHETAVISWVAVRGKMSFRASGGDDSVMPFYRVEVVAPPSVESLQVTLKPPTYSRRPTETLPQGVGHIQGLLGTKVEVTASSDKPLGTAKLRIADQAPVPLTVGEDGRTFTAAFEIKDALASTYWFELTDLQGFTDREAVRYELRGIADGVPDIVIDQPVTDVMLTTDAELPVKILAKDDLGLKQVRIAYEVSGDETVRTIPLFEHRASAEGESSEGANGAQNVGPQRHEAEFVWKMADLKAEPGMRIVFRGEATDDYDLNQPHIGKSVPRTITIVSRDDKQKELATRVGELLEDLQQATKIQQRARQETQELQTQLEKVGELRPQDVDQLQRTELDQRQAASRLTQPADGVQSQAKQLLDEFRANRLNDEPTEQRLERVANELARLERDELPDAERALTRAQKLAEGKSHSESGSESKDGSTEEEAKVNQKSISPPAKMGSKSKPSSTGEASKDGSQSKDSAGDGQETGDKTVQDPAAEKTKPAKSDADKSDGATKPDKASNPDQSAQDDSMKPEEGQGSEKTRSGETAKPNQPADKALEAALAEAQTQQSRSLETLQELQDALSEWRDRRDVSRDLDSVINEQDALQKESAEMAQRTLQKSSAEVTKQEKAELNKLSARQRKVAEQFEQFRKQLEQTAQNLQKSDPDAAEKLNEAIQELKQHETASKLQEAAQNIADNQMGAAVDAQQKAAEDLHEIERMIKRQPNEDTEQFLKQTEEAQQEFQQIRQDQQNLADQAQELAKQPDSPEKRQQMKDLMEQQEELAERMAKAERKLEKLRLRGPADAAHRARKRVSEMMKQMQEAEDNEEMQAAMDEALDDLEQVERELVLEKRIAQERLAFEQLEKIEDELKALKTRLETVIAETTRLNDLKLEQDELTRGQLRTLHDLAETGRSLQNSVGQMQQHMASAEVFSLMLKRLARSLGQAADRLDERDTSNETVALEQDAIRKIETLLSVLKQEKKEKKPPGEQPEELANEPQEQEEKPEEAQPPGDMVSQLAQLKLLKSMQEEYLERTEALEKFRDKDGKLPESKEAEKNELAREQVELADFTRNLVAKFLQQQPERKDSEEDAPKPKSKGPEKESDPTKIEP